MSIFFGTFVLHVLAGWSTAVYVDYGNPYELGEFEDQLETVLFTPILPDRENSTMQNKVYYPVVPGEYAVFYFIGGFGGVIPPIVYNDTLEMIATHGYVVIGSFPVIGEDGPGFQADDHMANLEWLMENAADVMNGTIPDFNHMAIGCHSAGCGPPMDMYLMNNNIAQAQVNIEPVTNSIRRQNMSFSVPVVNMGAELANMTCSYPGVDFETFDQKWSCPKTRIEAADVGHCCFLDEVYYLGCTAINFCPSEPETDRDAYRLFVAGLSSAFATAYAQGNLDQLKYVTDPDLVNWPMLQHEYTEEC